MKNDDDHDDGGTEEENYVIIIKNGMRWNRKEKENSLTELTTLLTTIFCG